MSVWKDWRVALPRDVARRAHRLSAAIDGVSGIYLPNRLHRVRIAMKKLRYTLEVAAAAGLPTEPHLIRDLRKGQELLGGMHDLHVAQRAVQNAEVSSKTLASGIALLEAVIGAECAALHWKYLARRDRLLAASDHAATLAGSRPAAWTVQLVMKALRQSAS